SRQLATLQIGAELNLVRSDLALAHGSDRLPGQFDIEVGDADLAGQASSLGIGQGFHVLGQRHAVAGCRPVDQGQVYIVGAQLLQAVLQAGQQDRKSTRLNSSHVKISYAVFCLKKKKEIIKEATRQYNIS